MFRTRRDVEILRFRALARNCLLYSHFHFLLQEMRKISLEGRKLTLKSLRIRDWVVEKKLSSVSWDSSCHIFFSLIFILGRNSITLRRKLEVSNWFHLTPLCQCPEEIIYIFIWIGWKEKFSNRLTFYIKKKHHFILKQTTTHTTLLDCFCLKG